VILSPRTKLTLEYHSSTPCHNDHTNNTRMHSQSSNPRDTLYCSSVSPPSECQWSTVVTTVPPSQCEWSAIVLWNEVSLCSAIDLDIWPFNPRTMSLLVYPKAIPCANSEHFYILRFFYLCCGQTNRLTNRQTDGLEHDTHTNRHSRQPKLKVAE